MLALSVPAVAQEAPAPSPGPAVQLPIFQSPMVLSTNGARDRLKGGSADYLMRDSVGYDERLGRAQRLAALATSGECPSAFRIALRESDYEMAENLATACELPARDVRSMRSFAPR